MSFFGFDDHGPDLEREKQKFLAGGLNEDVAVYTWGEESYDGLGDSLQEGGDELNDETFGGIGPVGKDFDFVASTLENLPPKPSSGPSSLAQSKPPQSLWDDNSAFSVLKPRTNGAGRQEKPQFMRTVQDVEAEMRALQQQQQQTLQQQELEHQALLELQHRRREEELFLLEQRMQQEQQQRQFAQLQRERLQGTNTPPRMAPVSHSPRFLDHQRQLLYLQQQQEDHHRIQDLQDQISRLNQMSMQLGTGHPLPLPDRSRSRSPSLLNPLDQLSYLNDSLMSNQRLKFQLSQAELLLRDLSGLGSVNQVDQESLRLEAMRKIMETEKMEEKRRRKAAKIAHMARYNDLMTQSDKDFITRIQVSQLVTQDPYADDFYAQVYGALLRQRAGQTQDERVLKFGSGLGVGLGLAQKPGSRRAASAMQRMEQQVERIVSNARRREEEKGHHSVHSLQGALGKTSGRSYKAAPRQLLQVDANSVHPVPSSPTLSHTRTQSHEDTRKGAAAQAAKLGREALGNAADTRDLVSKDPLTRREVLVSLETLYDLVLRVEQLRRDQSLAESDDALAEWQKEYDGLVNQIWDETKVMVPVATSNPHPFISLLSATKGKKILPRLCRHLDPQRMLTLLTLLIACFSQLDVVVQAPLLDTLAESPAREEAERQTQAFLSSVLQSILPTVVKGGLRLVTGLLGLFLDRNPILQVARTKPGLAMLTLFITRVEVIKQSITTTTDPADLPTPEDANQWQLMFDHLFELLSVDFPSLFPSTRLLASSGQHLDIPTESLDQPVWQFLAALALNAVPEQHQILVTALREKVLNNILSAKQGWVADEEEREAKLSNVNLFLHALGLDSSQIAL